MIPGQKGNHPTFRRSFLFAMQGFRFTLRTERNIKVMLAAGALVIVCGFIVGLDPLSWAIVLLCCACVISAELMNTAIETVVDLVSPEYHPLAGHRGRSGLCALRDRRYCRRDRIPECPPDLEEGAHERDG